MPAERASSIPGLLAMNELALSIRAAAQERPDGIAIITAAETLTFAEVYARTRRVLLTLDGPKTPVAIVASLRVETVLAIYALLELGRPIVLIHPRLTEAERAPLIKDSGATLLLDERWTVPPPAEAASASVSSVTRGREEKALAVLFTTGSSGTPKGVELSRSAFLAAAAASAENLGWQQNDRWLLCMPLAHVGGLSVVVRCLAARATVVLSPWTGSIPTLLDDVEKFEVTLLSLVPTMLGRVLGESPGYRFPPRVRAVLLGGDAASPALLAAAAASGAPVITTYGMTEACSQVATLSPGESALPENGVGKPLPGTEVRITDGEIQVRGATLLTRYLPVGRWPSPIDEDGWLKTGDLGHLDARGHLHVTGRRSDLIITGGENVDPREIEIALVRCAGVREACVFGVPDERWGQIVCAAVVLEEGAPASMASIAAHVQQVLASHKRPRKIAVCPALLLNSTGKLDRRATVASVLRALVPLASGSPGEKRSPWHGQSSLSTLATMLDREVLLHGAPAFVHNARVRFVDAVAGGHLFYPKMLELFHDAFEALFEANRVPLDQLLRDQTWGSPLVHADVEFLTELPKHGTSLQIVVTAAATQKNRVTFGYRAVDATTGHALAIGRTVHAFVEMATLQKIELPERVLGLLSRFPEGTVVRE